MLRHHGIALALLLLFLTAGKSASAKETCTCSSNYSVYHSGLTWVDYISVFPSWGPGPYTETRTATATHDYANEFVVNKAWIPFTSDTVLLIRMGAQETVCTDTSGDFYKAMAKRIQSTCQKNSGEDCSSLAPRCIYQNI